MNRSFCWCAFAAMIWLMIVPAGTWADVEHPPIRINPSPPAPATTPIRAEDPKRFLAVQRWEVAVAARCGGDQRSLDLRGGYLDAGAQREWRVRGLIDRQEGLSDRLPLWSGDVSGMGAEHTTVTVGMLGAPATAEGEERSSGDMHGNFRLQMDMRTGEATFTLSEIQFSGAGTQRQSMTGQQDDITHNAGYMGNLVVGSPLTTPVRLPPRGTDLRVAFSDPKGCLNLNGNLPLMVAATFKPRNMDADAGGPYTILRSQRVKLDGSHSRGPKGKPTRYKWTVTPSQCPAPPRMPGAANADNDDPETRPAQAAPKTHDGPTWSFVVLCDADVKLEVWDKDGTRAEDHTTIAAKPRPWKFAVGETPKTTPHKLPPGALGYNVCKDSSHEPPDSLDAWDHRLTDPLHITEGEEHTETGDHWRTRQVTDPDGPFDGWYYVDKGSEPLSLSWQPYISEDLVGADNKAWQDTLDSVRQAGYRILVEDIQRHEETHWKLAKEQRGVAGIDPLLDMETRVSKDRELIRRQVTADLKTGMFAIRDAASDYATVARLCKEHPNLAVAIEFDSYLNPVHTTKWAKDYVDCACRDLTDAPANNLTPEDKRALDSAIGSCKKAKTRSQ